MAETNTLEAAPMAAAGTITAKAAVLRTLGGALSVETLRLRSPEAGEVRVKIRACAVCHSDLSYADGIWGSAVPVVLGHEAAGVIEAVGEGVTRAAVGDRVVVTLIRSCQSCPSCECGAEVQCATPPAHAGALVDRNDEPVLQGMDTGAFAEAVLVDESQVAPIPETLGYEPASLLGCGVLTGFGAVRNVAKVRPGMSVAVIGCGGVGLNSIQGARDSGATIIVAVDPAASRREQALELGATHALDPLDANTAAQFQHLNGGGADAVFVATGHAEVMTQATAFLARGGQLVLLGMPPVGAMASYEPVSLAYYGQRIVGTRMGDAVVTRDVPMLARRYLEGSFALDELIGGTWPLDRINDAFAAARGSDGVRQIIVMDR